jgi:predicted metal-dependent phosphoesterase TrpH
MKNRGFFLFTLIWAITFLIICIQLYTSSIPEPQVIFFDALALQEVTAQYSITYSPIRLLLEPILGIGRVYLMTPVGLLSFLGIYLLLRLTILLDSKTQKNQSDQKENDMQKRFWTQIESILTITTSIMVLCIFIILIVLIIGFVLTSFLFIGWYAYTFLEIALWITTIIFIYMIIQTIITQYRPDGQIAIGWKKIQKKYYLWRSKRKFFNILTNKVQIKKMVKELRRIMVVFLFIGYFLFMVYFSPNPPRVIGTVKAPGEMLIDFHVHTSRSDGTIHPIDRVNWYIGQGIDGAAFSDHHSTHGAQEAQDYVQRRNLNFTVIMAQEYTISEPRVHLNIYGLEEDINPVTYYPGIDLESPLLPGKILNVSDMIHYVKSQGAYVTMNHYGKPNAYTWEEIRDFGVDGFEIANGGGEQSRELRQFCIDNNLICIGGSDIHEGQDLDTFVRLKLEDPNNKTLDAIFAALRKNQHEVVVVRNQRGSPSTLQWLNPDMDEYFAGLSREQRYSWIYWGIGTYIIGIVIKIQQINIRKKSN